MVNDEPVLRGIKSRMVEIITLYQKVGQWKMAAGAMTHYIMSDHCVVSLQQISSAFNVMNFRFRAVYETREQRCTRITQKVYNNRKFSRAVCAKERETVVYACGLPVLDDCRERKCRRRKASLKLLRF